MIYVVSRGDEGGIRTHVNALVRLCNEELELPSVHLELLDSNHMNFKILKNFDHKSTQGNRLSAAEFTKHLRLQKEDILIANDASTLEFLRNTTIPCRLVVILHGDYVYYEQTALRFGAWVDAVFSVSRNLYFRIHNLLPPSTQTLYLPPLLKLHTLPRATKDKRLIAFVGRSSRAKGAHLLPQIDAHLIRKGIVLNWVILTHDKEGDAAEFLNPWVSANTRCTWHMQATNEQVLQVLSTASIFVLPSAAEGFPLSLVEALSQGCIPVLSRYNPDVENHIPPEFHHLVAHDFEPSSFASRIQSALDLCDDSGVLSAQRFYRENLNPKNAQDVLCALPRLSSKRKTPMRFQILQWQRRFERAKRTLFSKARRTESF